MKLRLESVTADNAREVAKLWYESWLSNDAEHEENVTVETLLERLRNEKWETYLHKERGDLVGFLALDIEASLLSQLFVAPGYQNHGIGEQLLDLAKSKLPNGFALRTHTRNAGSRRFYERHGFTLDRIDEETDTAFYEWSPSR